jgi:hypothetical protein
MSVFQTAFDKIATEIGDLTSLDVVTFKGSINSTLTGDNMPKDFESVLKLAGQNNATVTLLASTQTKLDGDILAYFDSAIKPEELAMHNELVKLGQENRKSTIELFRNIIKDIS